jgi:NAD(P)-dependent dehydrogenase (short-subunit alcohol dehydrogenase family)
VENLTQPILVTGASSGIGNHITRYLAERGLRVYAAARKDADLVALDAIENVTPLKIDVRDPDLIQAAREQVPRQGAGLYGLVNNAGIGGLGLLSTWTDAEMADIFDVNVYGPHRMTNAFLPLLLESRGRIVNIGSQGGMITSKYYGPYTMTKHALEAYTLCLHLELESYGVWASIVQPGGIISRVGENAWDGIVARFQRAQPPFDAEAQAVLRSFEQPAERDADAPESETNRKPSSPEIVSAAVYQALFSSQHKLRYLVGTQWEGDRVVHALIEKLLDENDNPQHNYSRDELVAYLDQHLQRRQAA